MNDLYVWNPSTWAWDECLQENRIARRNSAGMTSLAGRLFIFGGSGESGRLNDLQLWEPLSSRWIEVTANSSEVPTPRNGHGFASLESTQTMYVFGGVVTCTWSGQDRLSSSFFGYNFSSGKWRNFSHMAHAISPRSHFGFASSENKLFLLGGIVEITVACTLFEFCPVRDSWTCAASTENQLPSFLAAPGLLSIKEKIYVFGGFTTSGTISCCYALVHVRSAQ